MVRLLNSLLYVLVTVICSVLSIQAQNRTCDLRINVFEYKTEKRTEYASEIIMDESTVVTNAKAVLENTKTKKIFNSTLVGRTPYFRKLTDGDYNLTTSKAGYKKLIQKVSLKCEYANSEKIFCETAFLRKGATNQIVDERGRRLDVSTIGGNPSGGCYYSPAELKKLKEKSDSEEILNSKAITLVKPPYPQAARAVSASGIVKVLVTINEKGNVTSAEVISGHPLLREASEKAAKESKFTPTLVNGKPVTVTGVITYTFTAP